MRRKPLIFGVPGFFGSLALPSDLFGLAAMISKELELVTAFLPWVGTVLAAGFGVWLLLFLAIDIPRYERLRERQKRRRIAATMQRVADAMCWYAATGENSFAVSDERTRPTERERAGIGLDIEELKRMALMPNPTKERTEHNDIANQLYRTIPVLERKGIPQAQEQTRAMNAFWKERGDG